ncbi:hypothetical protein GEMRC1_003064 [Eukaryota sp. GEM-RC1]
MRFSNVIFEPILNSHYIESIELSFLEKTGVVGRGGYYSKAGVIRDVIQNHILTVLSLIGLECPASLSAEDVRNESVKFLRAVQSLSISDVITGQYVSNGSHPGFLDDPSIPSDCNVPTYCAAILSCNNRRWEGVPIIVRAGKGLDKNAGYIKIKFKRPPGFASLFAHKPTTPGTTCENSLLLSIQPESGLELTLTGKNPGYETVLSQLNLNMFYRNIGVEKMPDAYESVLLSMMCFDQSLFLRHDQIQECWRIVDDLLPVLDDNPQHFDYAFGSRGPIEADEFIGRIGLRWAV